MSYDNLGHKTKMIDPDLGTWYYEHNALGELTRQIDANHNNTFISYDALGRVISKSTRKGDNAEWKHASWIYDTKVIGALSRVESGSSTYSKDIIKEYAYDAKLRPINEKVIISGKHYNTRTRYYEDTGLVSSITHPNGYRVSYGYNNGQLEKDAHARAKIVRYNAPKMDKKILCHIDTHAYHDSVSIQNQFFCFSMSVMKCYKLLQI